MSGRDDILNLAPRCPLCGEANDCPRSDKTEFRGSCWCEEERFPPTLLESVPENLRNRSCICLRCVVKARRADAMARPLPSPRAEDFYSEKGLLVFTESYHRRRGYCCGGGCRHCPFEGLERELAFGKEE